MSNPIIISAARLRIAIDSMYSTNVEAATALGLSTVYLSKLLSGSAAIGFKTTTALEKVGINSDWVLHGKGVMLTEPKQSRFYKVFADMFAQEQGTVQQEPANREERDQGIKELQARMLELEARILRLEAKAAD